MAEVIQFSGGRRLYALSLLWGTAQRLQTSRAARPGPAGALVASFLVFLHAMRSVLIPGLPNTLGHLRHAFSLHRTSLQPRAVLGGDWGRLWSSAAVHLDAVHLTYNLCGFLGLAVRMEHAFGSAGFGMLVIYLGVAGGLLYAFLAVVLAEVLADFGPLNGAVAGFSGVVFGLMTVAAGTPGLAPGTENFYGVRVPGRLRHWKELFLCKILIPESSLLGHFCGILAGISFLKLRSLPMPFLMGR